MKLSDLSQIFVYVFALVLLAPWLAEFISQLFFGQRTLLHPVFERLEKWLYRVCKIDPKEEMNWKDYCIALLIFNFLGFAFVFVLQITQNFLPLNPQNLPRVSWHSALNTAISFMTNTNWQGYAGESTMSYFTQALGLTVQNFLSAASGVAVFFALTRGLIRKSQGSLGNFWVDLTRTTVYLLLPLSILFSIVLVGQGVVQNFSPYVSVKTLEGATQVLPMGPAASQIAIKQLGTNGGGFFNANSAHPFENPTPLSNFLQMLAILLLPAALVLAYGKMVGARSQGWTLFAVMFLVWFLSLVFSMAAEFQTNPNFNLGSLMEGKETRFGVTNSLIWSTATTVASNGSVNAMHASLSPSAGGLAIFNIMLGEVIFGGVGAGMYGMLLYVFLTVFLAGLMVGRSPEYLGKKIEAPEIKMAILGILGPCAVILVGAAISVDLPLATASLANKGPHGFSEILYAFTSAAGNNGSAFAGLNANTPYFNLMLGLVMLVGRFVVIIPSLAIAGHLVSKKISPPSTGTFASDTPLFGILLIAVIVIVGALTFLRALSLGPLVEHFLMLQKQVF